MKWVLFWLGVNADNKLYTCELTYVFFKRKIFESKINDYVATWCKMHSDFYLIV